MKNIIGVVVAINCLAAGPCFAQGWVAEVNVDLNHGLYAYETIENARLTFSGITVSGSSDRSNIQFTVKGTGSPSGDINLSISGTAFEPYDPNDPSRQSLYGQLVANYKTPCTTGYFKSENTVMHEQVSLWITFYPRLEINTYVQDCDKITLTTSSCYPTLFWEVSDNISENYKTVPGEMGTFMSITREELVSLGLESAHGKIYFKVSGTPGTTSQLQPVETYYRSPNAAISATPPKCHNGTDGSIEIKVLSPDASVINDFVITLHKAAPPEQAVRQVYLNDGVNMSFSEIAAGNYWIRIENNSSEVYGSCWTDFALDPLVNPEPVTIASFEVSNYHGYPIKCHGGNDGTLKVNALGGTGSYSAFKWIPGVSTSAFADSLPQGTYSIKVQDSNGCWSGTHSRTLDAPDELSVNLISSGGKNGFDVSCYDKSDGALSTDVRGGVPQYAYSWSSGASENSINNLDIGSYSLIVTDANGCTTGESTQLAAPEPIEFAIREISPVNCSGDSSGILEADSIINTIGHVFYSWSSGEIEREIVNKPGGTYTLTVSDGQGCSSARSHTLKEPTPYTVHAFATSDFNGSAIRCDGEANGQLASLVRDDAGNVTTAEHYAWYKNGSELISGPQASKVSELSAGNYRVVITYKTFCYAETIFVMDDPAPLSTEIVVTSNYNGMAISCSGEEDGSIKAIASGANGSYNYAWDTGDTGSELKDVGAGTYVVTARDINGCESQSIKTLESPLPLEASISVLSNYNGQPISCFDASDAHIRAFAKGGTFPYNYSWNSEGDAEELVGIQAGKYSLTISDVNGCLAVADTTLMNPDPVQARIAEISNYNGYGVSCNGSADGFIRAGGSGGTGQYEFAWKESLHDQPVYENVEPGEYVVTVRDQNGCHHIAQALVTEPESLSVGVAAAKSISCNGGDDGRIELFATGGAGAYEYSVDNSHWQNGSLFEGLDAGDYHPTVRDGNGCTQATAQLLEEPSALMIRFEDIQPAFCGDPRGSVSALVSGGTGRYQYIWKNPEQEIVSEGSHLSGLSSGIYSLKVLDEHLCESSESVGITSTDGPRAVITNVIAPTCSYSLNGSASVEITQGEAPFVFEWEDGQNTSKATNLGAGNHLIQITDSNNCMIVESVHIIAPDPLQIETVETAEPLCHGDCNGRLVVSSRGGNGDYNYIWEGFTGPEATDLCAGSYEVIVYDKQGCKSSRTFSLAQPDPVVIKSISQKSPTCANGCDGILEAAAFGGTGEVRYSWSTGEGQPMISNLCSGLYTITAIDGNHCFQTETITLEDPARTTLDLGGSKTLCNGQTHVLDAGTQWQSVSWTSSTGFKSSSPQITISEAGRYGLNAVTPNGCLVQDTFLLETSMDLLKANFLVTAEAMPEDTVVMIDISWPLPDSIRWRLPKEMIRLEDYGDMLYGKFHDPGHYDISLVATLGDCRDEMTKTIRVSNGDNVMEEGRLGNQSFVKKFSLFPNPNDGVFDVEVEFSEESPILLSVWNTLTSQKIGQLEDSGLTRYVKHVNLQPLSAGQYTLRLDYRKGTKHLRFIVR